jgi:aminoglycoside phosphotransferase (APT) family kinase protein
VLGALSSLDPKDVGLENFGSHKPYFPRQLKSLSKLSLAQAAVKDVDTDKAVGELPGWRELVAWYERNLPDERKTGVRIVHGDYKLDNLVFHPTENRVIGVLDWELCTLGSPVRAFAYRRSLRLGRGDALTTGFALANKLRSWSIWQT